MKQLFLGLFLFTSGAAFAQTPDTVTAASAASTDPFIRDSLEIARVKLIRPQFKFDNLL
jgi:hypothetical protein